METKPTRRVGQRYRDHDGDEFEIIKVRDDGEYDIRWLGKAAEVGYGTRFDEFTFGSNQCVLLGGPPDTSTPPKPRDWSRWLPPHELPSSESPAFKVGQVWALHSTLNGEPFAEVFRVTGVKSPPRSHWIDVEPLAGEMQRSYSNRQFTDHAILVADVGCEPTPPEVLYGAPPPVGEPVMGVGPLSWGPHPRPAGCLACGEPLDGERVIEAGMYVFLCYRHNELGKEKSGQQLWDAWKAGARNFPRTPPKPSAADDLTDAMKYALTGIDYGAPTPTPREAPRAPKVTAKPEGSTREATFTRDSLGYTHVGNMTALHKVQPRKPPPPWQPSVDDWDLLPDQGTSWSATPILKGGESR